jgi:hypothetical protein
MAAVDDNRTSPLKATDDHFIIDGQAHSNRVTR